MSANYIFRLDDITPNMNWGSYVRLRTIFQSFKIKPIIGVVPDNRDPELSKFPQIPVDFWTEVRARRDDGWHVAMHGYQHVYDSRASGLLDISPRSEFSGHSYNKQLERLIAAKKIFYEHGLDISTFIAPSHSYDQSTLEALIHLGIKNVSDGFSLFPYRSQGLLFVPQLFEGPYCFPAGLLTFCFHSNSFSENHFWRLEKFLQNHSQDCISFDDAPNFECLGAWNTYVGEMVNALLKVKRKISQCCS